MPPREHRLERLFFMSTLSLALMTGVAYAQSDRSIALVLDASGSMKAQLPDGASRMDAAKAAVEQLVTRLSADTRVAFRAYGHQSRPQQRNCNDTALLVPFASVANNKASIVKTANRLEPQGYTPITLSLTLAAQDLGREEAGSRVVILVSDGKETCPADPCAAAKALAEADAKLVVHTIGAGVDEVTRRQLQCIASVARGSYFDANSAVELSNVLSKVAVTKAAAAPENAPAKKQVVLSTPKLGKLKMAVAGQFSHDVLDQAGQTVEKLSSTKREVELPPGIYSVKFANGLWSSLQVEPGKTTEIVPGYLEVQPMGSHFVDVLEPETGEIVEKLLFSKPRATLIPGRFDVRFGNVLWPGGVDLKPGQTITLRPGVLKVKSRVGIFKFIVRDAGGQEAGKGNVPGNSRLALPPGRYVLELDPSKWIKTIPDAMRTVAVDLAEGQEFEINLE
jgi:hypothetical protein